MRIAPVSARVVSISDGVAEVDLVVEDEILSPELAPAAVAVGVGPTMVVPTLNSSAMADLRSDLLPSTAAPYHAWLSLRGGRRDDPATS
jgi:hypothetical protein